MDRLQPDAMWRYWIREHNAEVYVADIGEDMGQMATGVKIAQLELSDLGRDACLRANHASRKPSVI